VGDVCAESEGLPILFLSANHCRVSASIDAPSVFVAQASTSTTLPGC